MGGLLPCSKADGMMVTGVAAGTLESSGLWGYTDLSSATLSVTLTNPFLSLGGLRVGK